LQSWSFAFSHDVGRAYAERGAYAEQGLLWYALPFIFFRKIILFVSDLLVCLSVKKQINFPIKLALNQLIHD